MIVLVASMPRSGSTFAFNIVREVLQRSGHVYHETSEDVLGAVSRSNGARHVIVKAHNFDAPSLELARAGAFRIIMTIRRVEDAMASWLEIFDTLPEDISLQVMRQWLWIYQQLRPHSMVVPYDEIDRHPWRGAWHIASALRPATIRLADVIQAARRFGKAEVKRQTDQLTLNAPGVVDAGFSYYDPTTFFHRRHVSGLRSRPARERLDQDRLLRLRAAIEADVQAAGLLW